MHVSLYAVRVGEPYDLFKHTNRSPGTSGGDSILVVQVALEEVALALEVWGGDSRPIRQVQYVDRLACPHGSKRCDAA